MKKLLVIAVALAAVNAQATRARVAALANSPHLIDTQTVYNNPADIFALGSDYVNLETGLTNSTTSTDGAEGMVVRSMGDTKWGLSLGHDSMNGSAWGLRGLAAGANAGFATNQQNPLELTYGAKAADMSWAATLVYSNYQDKVTTAAATAVKESSMGVRVGARAANWDAALRLGLTSTVETGDGSKYTGTAAIGANGGYMMDSWYLFANILSAGFKTENGAGAETSKFNTTSIALGALTEVKKDGSGFFYGASLNNSTSKEDVGDSKTSSMTLPVWVGVEVDAASWLTLRGSITQTLQLLNNSKSETGGTTTSELAPGANDTVVTAGAGLKFNKITVDGTLQGSTNQQLNGNNLLAMLGMTYWY
ncbi:MAG: hypothetical protein K0R29_1051 [Pseudobdellovibrio sp.]|jgi:hypothetical protein|nr:hypothetical protein [Pseudobdellovibrio sp.]